MEISGFLLQATYRVRSGRPVVQLYGRATDDGGNPGVPFLVEDDREAPYFFAAASVEAQLRDRPQVSVTPSELLGLDGERVVEVRTAIPADVPPLRERIGSRNAYEADVRFPIRYLIDRGIRSGVRVVGEGEQRGGLLRFANPDVKASDVVPVLRRLSLDIETTPDASTVFSVAIYGDDADEVWLISERPVEGAEIVPDEQALLRMFTTRIQELDPDVLVGWNVVGFDLKVLAARCRALDVAMNLGRTRGEMRIYEDRGPGGPRAEIPGRVVLDALPIARESLKLPDYRLDTVAKSVLGRGKRLDPEVPDKAAEIGRLRREDPEALVAYNREDARLVLEILDREGLFALCVERSSLSGMSLDRVSASIASFDRLYLPALRQRGRVAPCVDATRSVRGLSGGALIEPVPGFHRDVVAYDFKSLYPTLIQTFGLDPLAFALAGPGAIEAPNGARFDREIAILPELIGDLMSARAAAKTRGDAHASHAIKIMMNSLYGVLGASACRFFEPEIANAITQFGQQTLSWASEAFREQGVRVIYGDTDSVFVALDDPSTAAALLLRAQQTISRRIKETYGVSSALELELDTIYHRFFLPRVRGGGSGSKKRYAGLTDDGVRSVGLESVRRDWPEIAGRLQKGMLARAFADEEVLPFVREVVAQLRAGECDEELVYRKRVRKSSLDRYTANTPHVVAARKLGARAGSVVHYVMTPTGAEPLRPGEAPPGDLDRRHYIERVLRPVAESILVELGESFDTALGNPTQMQLL